MDVRKTSVSSTTVKLTASASEALSPSNRRIGIIVSGGATAFSLSFSPTPLLGASEFNFLASGQWPLVLTAEEIGNAIRQPIYGIASGNMTLIIGEILDGDT